MPKETNQAEGIIQQTLRKVELLIYNTIGKEESCLWVSTRDKTGIEITPQVLREWFCNNLKAEDRYIDAFCGRTPRSVLAKHYSDYSPEKLKTIYDKANLRVSS